MEIVTIIQDTNYGFLVEITNKLNGANQHPAGSLDGMFFRRQDFEFSAIELMQKLSAEYIVATTFAKDGYNKDDFLQALKKSKIRSHMHTNSSFDTYDLSPALRHFLNDYCRILEPLVKLVQLKHPSVSAQNTRRDGEMIPFNSYIKSLDRARITTTFDHTFFIKIYDELWNDYKHAESSGVQASGWSTNGEAITSEPKLYCNKLVYFKDMPVKDFIDKSLDNMNALLNYIA